MGSSSSIHGTHCFSSSSLMCATTQQYYSTHNITFPHTSPPPSSCTKTSTSIIAHHGHHHESEQPLQLCKSIQSLACSWHLSTAPWYPHYHSASVVSKGSFYCLASNASSSIHHGNAEDKPFNALEAGGMVRESLGRVRHVLCLSNGHGEDAIAANMLKEVMELASDTKLKVEALPLVGVGSAYVHASIPTIGPSKKMPSGGFIYMDSQQLFNDLRAGLLGLTLDQWRTVAHWMDEHPDGFILAVGDIFPLALAWLASRKLRKKHNLARYFGYAFIGTAKSEYYIRGDDGKPLKSEWEGHLRGLLFPKSVYFPWERFIMADTYCRLIVPRDGLTCKILRRCLPAAAKDKVLDLGNPMMDGLEPTGVLTFLKKHLPAYVLTLLPGSRSPEVFANWNLLLEATNSVATIFPTVKKIFLAPVVPSLPTVPFIEAILEAGWHWSKEGKQTASQFSFLPSDCKLNTEMHENIKCSNIGSGVRIEREMPMFSFQKANTMIILLKGGFSDAISWADAGIAMAGTATEQAVGLGKPVFTLAGKGPQFTYEFAEAQARLLGKSVILCIDGAALASRMEEILSNEARLLEMSENGSKRMGHPGASKRIAEKIWSLLGFGCSFNL